MNGSSIWVECSAEMAKLAAAKAKAFGMLDNVARNKTSHYAKKAKDGTLKPDYADLAACFDCIRNAYSENGLSIGQTFHPFGDDGTIHLVTTLRHDSGQFERSYLPIHGRIPPQELAKAATYLRRIALCAIAGIAADDDDDGEHANKVAENAAASEEQRIEKLLTAKVRSSQDAESVAAVLDQVARGVETGHLSEPSAKRLRLIAAQVASKFPKPEESKQQDKKPEPAIAS